MTTETKGQFSARPVVIIPLILCILAGLFAFVVVKRTLNDLERLDLAWANGGLKLFSGSDGPFVVTHLFRPGDSTQERSVAQLPHPITIIDSRGHIFSDDEVSAMTWISRSGQTNTPPKRGDVIRAFYWVPRETDEAKNWK